MPRKRKYLNLLIIVATHIFVLSLAQVSYCDTLVPKNVTVTFQPHLDKYSRFDLLVGTRDILIAKIEPAEEVENIHFTAGFEYEGELMPDIFGGVLYVAELGSNPYEPGIKYLVLEAHEDVNQHAEDIKILAYRAPYRGRESHIASFPVMIHNECPNKGFYQGGEFVEEVCGESHVHENGQTIFLPEANSKHVYNAERGLKAGDEGYKEHNENVCQYCLEDEWFWWKTLGALRGAYNGPGSKPVQPLKYFFGETAGSAMGEALDATLVPALNWTGEEILMPVLNIVGMPFEYIGSQLQKIGVSRTDVDAILLHFAVGAVRVPQFRPLASFAQVSYAQRLSQIQPVLRAIRNQKLLQVPEFALNPRLQPVLVTGEGLVIAERLFTLQELDMFMVPGLKSVGTGLKTIRGAVTGVVGGTFNFFWDTTSIYGFLKDARKLVKMMRHMKLKYGVIQLIPGFIKKNPRSGLVWYPIFLGSLYATGEGPLTQAMPVIAENLSFFSTMADVTSKDMWHELSQHLPILGEDEIVVHVDAKAKKNDEHHIQSVRETKERLLTHYNQDQIWMADVSKLTDINSLRTKIHRENKKVKLLIWESYGNPGVLGFEPNAGGSLQVNQQTEISLARNLDFFKNLSHVVAPDGVLVLHASWVGSGTRGQNFIEDIHTSIVPQGILIAPTRVCHVNLGDAGSLDLDVLNYAFPGMLDLEHSIRNYFVHIRRLNNMAWVDSSEPVIKVIGK